MRQGGGNRSRSARGSTDAAFSLWAAAPRCCAPSAARRWRSGPPRTSSGSMPPRPGSRVPQAAQPEPVDRAQFPTPQPQPGGQTREYWLAARAIQWDIAPSGRDEWMNHAAARGAATFRAFVYQPYSAGFAQPVGRPRMPGPTLEAEVGDTIVVHFRNADDRFDQAVTVHPHGVRYNPEYDGAYLGDFTRAGGFVGPGEEFTYIVGGHARLGRRLALPRPRPEPHAQHAARPVRRDRGPREGRAGAGRRAGAVPAQPPAAGDRHRRACSTASTAAPPPATRRPSARASARTSPCT